MNAKQIIKILEQKCWKLDRIRGSHHMMTKAGYRTIPIPFHDNMDIDPKFIRIIEKQSGEKIL